jgi:hypothetical protein
MKMSMREELRIIWIKVQYAQRIGNVSTITVCLYIRGIELFQYFLNLDDQHTNTLIFPVIVDEKIPRSTFPEVERILY